MSLVQEYDRKINATIEAGEPICIEELIEGPSLIAHAQFEDDMINRDSRR